MSITNLPIEEQEAIEEDKQRWFKAWKMIKNTPPHEIRSWLASLKDQDYRDDMAKRLNQVKNNKGVKPYGS